jgi:hypothetical protein
MQWTFRGLIFPVTYAYLFREKNDESMKSLVLGVWKQEHSEGPQQQAGQLH